MSKLKLIDIELDKQTIQIEPFMGVEPVAVQELLIYRISRFGHISLDPIVVPIILN